MARFGRQSPLVVVADDDIEVRSLIGFALRRYGFSAATAANGEEALAAVAERAPAALVLDIMMPNLNGYEVVRRLRTDPLTARLPIVLVSARAGALDREFGLRLGANRYMLKPFSPRELVACVEELVEAEPQPLP